MLNIIYLLSFKVQCTFLEFSNIFGNDFLATSLQWFPLLSVEFIRHKEAVWKYVLYLAKYLVDQLV